MHRHPNIAAKLIKKSDIKEFRVYNLKPRKYPIAEKTANNSTDRKTTFRNMISLRHLHFGTLSTKEMVRFQYGDLSLCLRVCKTDDT